MSILRNPRKANFTVVGNHALRDQELSLKARGLLVSMMSLPDNWEFSEAGLYAIFPKDGLTSIKSGLKELEAGGYLQRSQARDCRGHMGNAIWTISDYPITENPMSENPMTVNPMSENQRQLNKDLSSKEESNKDRSKNESVGAKPHARFVPPSLEEVSDYCQERGNSIDPERFVDYYTANGWMVGKSHMKDWKAAVRNWEKKETEKAEKPESESSWQDLKIGTYL